MIRVGGVQIKLSNSGIVGEQGRGGLKGWIRSEVGSKHGVESRSRQIWLYRNSVLSETAEKRCKLLQGLISSRVRNL